MKINSPLWCLWFGFFYFSGSQHVSPACDGILSSQAKSQNRTTTKKTTDYNSYSQQQQKKEKRHKKKSIVFEDLANLVQSWNSPPLNTCIMIKQQFYF